MAIALIPIPWAVDPAQRYHAIPVTVVVNAAAYRLELARRSFVFSALADERAKLAQRGGARALLASVAILRGVS